MSRLEQVTCRCDRCNRPLPEDRWQLSMTTVGGTRRVYECGCGAVTVTIVREEPA